MNTVKHIPTCPIPSRPSPGWYEEDKGVLVLQPRKTLTASLFELLTVWTGVQDWNSSKKECLAVYSSIVLTSRWLVLTSRWLGLARALTRLFSLFLILLSLRHLMSF